MTIKNFVQVLILIAMVQVALSGCGGAENRKEKYIQDGIVRFQEENYEKARISFKNAMQIDPKDTNARYHYATALEKLQDWRGAAGNYKKVVEDDPKMSDARIHLGQMYLLARAVDLADEQADAVLQTDPNHVAALSLKAAVFAVKNNTEEALKTIEKALSIAPEDSDSLILASTIQRALGHSEKALALLETGRKLHPEKSDFILLLAQNYQNEKKYDEAEAMYEQAIKSFPKVFEHRMALARFWADKGNTEKVESTLTEAIKDFPENSKPRLLLVDFFLKNKKQDQAISLLENSEKEFPEQYDYQFALSDIYAAKRDSKKVTEILNKIMNSTKDGDAPNLKAKNKLALQALNENKVERAEQLIDQILYKNKSDQSALLLRAKLALNKKIPESAIPDLRSLLRDDPTNKEAQSLLVAAHLMNGESALALEVMEKLAESDPTDSLLQLQLSDLYIKAQNLDKAETIIKRVLVKEPLKPVLWETLIKVNILKKDFNAVSENAAKLSEIDSSSGSYLYYSGLAQQYQGNMDGALKAYSQALEKKPGAYEPLSALVGILSSQGKYDQAITEIDSILAKNVNNVAATNLKGEVLLAKKDYVGAEKVFRTLTESNEKWDIPWKNIYLSLKLQNNLAEANKLIQQGIDKTAGSPLLREILAAELEKANNIDGAIEQYEKIIATVNDPAAAMNNLAMLLVSYKTDKESLDKALKLTQKMRSSGNPLLLDTVAWVHYKRSEYAEGLNFAKQAVDKSPGNPLLHYHLGMLYLKLDQKPLAKQELSIAAKSDSQFPGLTEAKSVYGQLQSEG